MSRGKNNNVKWIIALLIIVAGQWMLHQYGIFDKIFSRSDERKIAHWRAPMDPEYTSDKPGKSPMGMDLVPVYEDELPGQAGQQQTEESIAGVDYFYTCGMHPNIRETEPGICPICNMNLVKKTVSQGGNPAQVSIDPVTVQNIGVRTALVEKRKLAKTIRAYGKVQFDDRRTASVSSKVSGWAEKLYVDFEGQYVRKGAPLIDIYSPDLVATQEEYLKAVELEKKLKVTGNQEFASHTSELLKSTKRRLQLWDISEEQIRELETSGEVKKTLTLYAPVSGVVTTKKINEGDAVKPNMAMYSITDLSAVWVVADIYEYELPWVKIGQDVIMELSYEPGKEFNGKINYIYPYLDPKTRTGRVRFEFKNSEMALKPDMHVNVIIQSSIDEDKIVIPVSSVILSGERNLVIIALGEGKFEPKNIKIGIESNGFYAVEEGLNEGEKVVTSAQFLIDSESRLKEAQMKMLTPEEEVPVKTTVTLIGEGDMKYTCPMPEDMVFSSEPGSCPECGMDLKEMTPDQVKQMNNLLETHEAEKYKIFEETEEHKGHDHSAEAPGSEDNQSVLIFGEGELTHFCPMEEDLVFADSEGECPRCGMFLAEMDQDEKNKSSELIKDREVIRIIDKDHVHIEALEEYASFTEKPLILIGENDMTHTCPMDECLLFSNGEEECSRCGMKLKEMTSSQKNRFDKLKKNREIIRISSSKAIKVTEGGK
ncbi:MAG: efflux RND transporter periplasmic adaptor subunit [bacterium]|nr:efflux RND transporter periplasmic adaptor subunit [bacterium]